MNEVDDDNAEQILTHARQRALGRRPHLRRLSVLLWASFLGAALSTLVLVLTPESWPLPPEQLGGAARVFGVLWLLSLVPATIAAVLAEGPR